MVEIVKREYRLANNGYMVRRGKYGQYFYEHRDVWGSAHGPILPGHHIHHKNKNRQDNRLENLECIEAEEHLRMHGMSPEMTGHLRCLRQSAPDRMVDCYACDKHFVTKHRVKKFCSHGCMVKYRNWLWDAKKAARRALLRSEVSCATCGGRFMQKQNNQRFCTPACKLIDDRKVATIKKRSKRIIINLS